MHHVRRLAVLTACILLPAALVAIAPGVTANAAEECTTGPPTAPTSVSGKGGLRKAVITWGEPTCVGEGGVTKYRITVSPGGTVIDNISPTATSHTVTGLAITRTYTFYLRASNAAGEGPAGVKTLVGTNATVSSKSIAYAIGSSTTVTGRVWRISDGVGLGGREIRLQARQKGATSWRVIASPKTSSSGNYSVPVEPKVNTEYRVVYYSGNWHYLGLVSGSGTVLVRQDVQLLGPSSVYRGRTVSFTTKVYPEHPGGTVRLQRYSGGKWNTIQSKSLSQSSYTYFNLTHSTPGTYKYRVYKSATSTHAAGYSPVHTLTVT